MITPNKPNCSKRESLLSQERSTLSPGASHKLSFLWAMGRVLPISGFAQKNTNPRVSLQCLGLFLQDCSVTVVSMHMSKIPWFGKGVRDKDKKCRKCTKNVIHGCHGCNPAW